MKHTDMIDYAHPLMMAEKHMKLAYENLLSNKDAAAIEDLLRVIVETRMAIAAIKHQKEVRESKEIRDTVQ